MKQAGRPRESAGADGALAVLVRDLLAHPALAGARVAGGAAGLGAPVRRVAVISRPDAALAVRDALVLLVPAPGAAGLEADMTLRYAAEGRAAGVLLPAAVVASSTGRIADRLGLPAVVHDAEDPHALAHALEAVVLAPRIARADALLSAARVVRRAGVDVTRAVGALGGLLAAPVALVDAEGAPLAGEAPALPDGLLAPSPRTLPAQGALLVAAPITLGEEAPEAWLVAGPLAAGPARAALASAVLELSAAGLAGTLARRRLAVERDAGLRAALLAELMALAGPPPPHLTERMVAAGWRTAGWHVGAHLAARGATGAERAAATPRVEALLAQHGLTGPVVQAPDGWSSWTTSEGEPEAGAYRGRIRAVRAVVHAAAPELVLHAGVGAPRAGARGIAETLAEARHAAGLAGAAGPRPAVEHAGDLEGRRLLLAWSASDAFGAYAESLLAPLLETGDAALLETLETYLEQESSAVSTAARLGLHRNTVSQRIRRAEALLGVSLGRADERLTVQLACRLLRLRGRA